MEQSEKNKAFLQLFHAWKNERGFKSDAAAAAELGIDRKKFHEYKTGRIYVDAYACTRLALAAQRDPITLIAEVEAEKETGTQRGAFWRDFFRRVTSRALLPGLLCMFFSGSASENGDVKKNSFTYQHIMRITIVFSLLGMLRALMPGARGMTARTQITIGNVLSSLQRA